MNLDPYFPHVLAELGEIRYRYVRKVEQLWVWSESVRWGPCMTSSDVTGFLPVLSVFIIRFPYKRSAPNVNNLWEQGRPYVSCNHKLHLRLFRKNGILNVRSAMVSLSTNLRSTPLAGLFVSGVEALVSVYRIFALRETSCWVFAPPCTTCSTHFTFI